MKVDTKRSVTKLHPLLGHIKVSPAVGLTQTEIKEKDRDLDQVDREVVEDFDEKRGLHGIVSEEYS